MAAVLRGAVTVEGDPELLFRFQRLFPAAASKRSGVMADSVVKILDGNTFVVSDERGDIEASPTDPTGLFSFDTRFLSKWVLTVNGERLNALSTDDLQYFETRFFLVPGHRDRLRRREAVGDPAARGRQRLPRGADDPQSRRRSRSSSTCGSTPAATSPTCSRSRTRWRRRASTRRSVDDGTAACSAYERETFSRGDRRSRRREPAKIDETRPHVRRRDRRRTAQWTTELDVCRPRRSAWSESRGARSARRCRRTAPRCRRASRSGSPTRRASSATGTRSRRRTGAASSTSPRCASRR